MIVCEGFSSSFPYFGNINFMIMYKQRNSWATSWHYIFGRVTYLRDTTSRT